MENNAMNTSAQSHASILPEVLQYKKSLRMLKRPYKHAEEAQIPLDKKIVKLDESLQKMKQSITDKLVANAGDSEMQCSADEQDLLREERNRKQYLEKAFSQLRKLHKEAGSSSVRLESVQETRV